MQVLNMLEKFLANEDVKDSVRKKKIVQRLITWDNLRIQVIKYKNIKSIILCLRLFRYRDCYFNNKSYLADLLLLK